MCARAVFVVSRNVKTFVAVTALLSFSLIGLSPPASAAELGVDIVSGGRSLLNPPFTLGWGFDVTSSISVTHLGFWDEGGDGLIESHDVGLWTSNGTLLAQTVVSNTSSTTIASVSGFGDWIFEALAQPIGLRTGTYIVAGVSGNDEFRTFVDNISIASGISNFDSGKYEGGSTLAFPTADENSEFSLFGANLLIVPEPTSFALLALGLAALGFTTRPVERFAYETLVNTK